MKERPPLFIPCVALFTLSALLLVAVLTVRVLASRAGLEGKHIGAASGAAISPAFFSPADASKAPCHLVRFARQGCSACARRYSKPYDNLEVAAVRGGCDSFVVTPFGDDFPSDGPHASSEIMLRAVSYDFAASTPFRGTPYTLLAGRDWKVLWSQAGIVSPQRAADGIARLRQYLSR
jgi:hypothetical protein